LIDLTGNILMKKHILLNRIKTLESQLQKKQPSTPITYFDEKLGVRMQIIGNVLALPEEEPTTFEQWMRMFETASQKITESK